ncbi:hypothetical protein CPB86DRAFT_426715 [Serendipita vermifera]|nr:hypothetical protein CPB86DRAFT_426715 [Serendipita vermifera]
MNSTAYKSASNHSFTLNTTTFSTQCERPGPFTLIYDPLPGRRGFSLETQSIPGETTVRNISLLTYPWSTSVPVLHNCTITPNFLLAKVECYSEYFLDVKIWDTIVKQLTSSSNDANSLDYGWSSRTERYIYDPLHTYYGPAAVDLRIVSLTDFGTRFATILNTYYQATISPEVRRGSFETGIYHNETKTTGSTIHSLSSPTYQRHWEWVILAHIASLAMLGVAIIGIWLDKQVVTPDVYGYVSSMTRDNPYFPLPSNGCTLEGTQRAVLLRDVVV